MRFTDGRENLEINIHEGQHGYDMTAVFFGNTPAHDENGIHHIESVRALLKDTLDRVLGLSGHPAPKRTHARSTPSRTWPARRSKKAPRVHPTFPTTCTASAADACLPKRTKTPAATLAGVTTATDGRPGMTSSLESSLNGLDMERGE